VVFWSVDGVGGCSDRRGLEIFFSDCSFPKSLKEPEAFAVVGMAGFSRGSRGSEFRHTSTTGAGTDRGYGLLLEPMLVSERQTFVMESIRLSVCIKKQPPRGWISDGPNTGAISLSTCSKVLQSQDIFSRGCKGGTFDPEGMTVEDMFTRLAYSKQHYFSVVNAEQKWWA